MERATLDALGPSQARTLFDLYHRRQHAVDCSPARAPPGRQSAATAARPAALEALATGALSDLASDGPPTRPPYPTGMLRFWDHRVAVLARLAGDATELVQSHRWMAVPAANLGGQQMAAPSG
jgi:hypothetical protein